MMPRARRSDYQAKRPIEYYDHRDKERLNNPPVGLVTPETDQDAARRTYSYDPHLDPQLQWAGRQSTPPSRCPPYPSMSTSA